MLIQINNDTMKTNKALVYFLLCLFFFSCNTKSEYRLKGVFTGEFEHSYEGQTVYLEELDNGDVNKLDSCVVVNNSFSFTEDIKDLNKLGFISYSYSYSPVMFVKEAGDIEIEIGDNGRRIGGTPINDSYQQFSDSLYTNMMGFRKFIVELEELKKAGALSLEKFSEKDIEMDQYIDMMEAYVIDYIAQQKGAPLASYVFYNDAYFVKAAKQKVIMSQLFGGKETEEIKKKMRELEAAESTAVGDKYVDVRGVNAKGDSLALSDVVGKSKLTLVDFWASWCGPCRESIPALQEIYAKYKSKGLTVVGVTVDENKKAWLAATDEEKVTWDQIATFRPDDIYNTYGVTGIPYVVLIDESGTIRATGHLSGLILEMKIRTLLEK